MNSAMIIAIAVSLVVGLAIGFGIFQFILSGKRNKMISEAERDAKTLKEKKLLEVKEEFLNKKAELEKEVQARNSKLLQVENKLKQREMSLNQRQDAITRRKNEQDKLQNSLEMQQQVILHKQEELDKLQKPIVFHEDGNVPLYKPVYNIEQTVNGELRFAITSLTDGGKYVRGNMLFYQYNGVNIYTDINNIIFVNNVLYLK